MSSWSFSAYSDAVRCLRKYKLYYIDKIVTPASESGDLAFGSALHSALNTILNDGDGEGVFEVYWNSYQHKDLNYGRYKWAELQVIGRKFLHNFQRLHAKKYNLYKAEERLYGEYKGVKIEGTPDFVGEYNHVMSLRDFKTSGYRYPKDKQAIALQLHLYAYLAEKNYGINIKQLGYTVFNKGSSSIQDLTWELDKSKQSDMLDAMVDYCEMLDKQTHYAKNPNSCIMGTMKCGYFDICWENK